MIIKEHNPGLLGDQNHSRWSQRLKQGCGNKQWWWQHPRTLSNHTNEPEGGCRVQTTTALQHSSNKASQTVSSLHDGLDFILYWNCTLLPHCSILCKVFPLFYAVFWYTKTLWIHLNEPPGMQNSFFPRPALQTLYVPAMWLGGLNQQLWGSSACTYTDNLFKSDIIFE